MKFILLLCFTMLFSESLYGHARLLPGGNTPGRSNNPGLKTGPCGGVAKGQPVATFNMGQTITLNWEETINHPGRFEFYISSDNDQTFTLLLTVQDNQNGNNDLPHRYTAQLQLPANLTCDNCTLRMIQQMTEDPNNPRPYFACSDIEITNSGTITPPRPVDETVNDVPEGHCD